MCNECYKFKHVAIATVYCVWASGLCMHRKSIYFCMELEGMDLSSLLSTWYMWHNNTNIHHSTINHKIYFLEYGRTLWWFFVVVVALCVLLFFHIWCCCYSVSMLHRFASVLFAVDGITLLYSHIWITYTRDKRARGQYFVEFISLVIVFRICNNLRKYPIISNWPVELAER